MRDPVWGREWPILAVSLRNGLYSIELRDHWFVLSSSYGVIPQAGDKVSLLSSSESSEEILGVAINGVVVFKTADVEFDRAVTVTMHVRGRVLPSSNGKFGFEISISTDTAKPGPPMSFPLVFDEARAAEEAMRVEIDGIRRYLKCKAGGM